MQNLIFILLFPLIIIGQTNYHQDNYGYGDQRYDMKGNSGLYEIQGSRFYHKKFLPSIINGKKVEIKFDAYTDTMFINFNTNYYENLLPYSNDLVLLLDSKEPWLAYNKKWYRLLFKKGNSTYLLKPIVELKKCPPQCPPIFQMRERYFVLKNGQLNKLRKKEVKKIGLERIIKS